MRRHFRRRRRFLRPQASSSRLWFPVGPLFHRAVFCLHDLYLSLSVQDRHLFFLPGDHSGLFFSRRFLTLGKATIFSSSLSSSYFLFSTMIFSFASSGELLRPGNCPPLAAPFASLPRLPFGQPPGPPPGPPPARVRAPPGPPPGPPPARLLPFAGRTLVRQFGSALDPIRPQQRMPLQQFQQQQQQQQQQPQNVVLSSDPKLIDPKLRLPQPLGAAENQQQPQVGAPSSGGVGATSVQDRENSGGATIVATPVLRINNVHPDVTRFTPTAVKVKRNKLSKQSINRKGVGKGKAPLVDGGSGGEAIVRDLAAAAAASSSSGFDDDNDPRLKATITDSAYENFMKEIEQLL